MDSIDEYKGCLIAGAIGDALGYPIEFLNEKKIFSSYGEKGLTEFDTVNGIAQISDDTQMSMFTANGLLVAATFSKIKREKPKYVKCIADSYKDWLITQSESFSSHSKGNNSWLLNESRLFSSREPGHTCLSAILSGSNGTIADPINNSKGCGGIMRVAPIGLFFSSKYHSFEEIDKLAAESSALTHGHDLGYMPSAVVAHIISLVSHDDDISLISAVRSAKSFVEELFKDKEHIGELIALIDKAIELSQKDIDDLEAIHLLGEGWVAEETLAIALYCSLKYSDDIQKALIVSVNHKGDSDSTGAVTGNILGAYLGYEKIPQKYLDELELKDVILELASDLYNGSHMSTLDYLNDKSWLVKYYH